MESMTARTTKRPTRRWSVARATRPARPTTSSAKRPTFALSLTGCATATMTAVTTVMKILYTARSALAHPTASVAQTTGAFQPLGTAMVTPTAVMAATSRQSTANRRAALALATFSPATTATAYLEFTFAMVSCIFHLCKTKYVQFSKSKKLILQEHTFFMTEK